MHVKGVREVRDLSVRLGKFQCFGLVGLLMVCVCLDFYQAVLGGMFVLVTN